MRHRGKFLVAAANNFFQRFERLILFLQIEKRERLIIASQLAGIGAGKFVGHGGKFWQRVLRASLGVRISEFTGLDRHVGLADGRVINFHGVVESGGSEDGLAIVVKLPAAVDQDRSDGNRDENGGSLAMRIDGLGAVLQRFAEFVLL